MMESNTSCGTKVGEWRHQTTPLPRKRLSDISNLSLKTMKKGKIGSSVMVNEDIAKLLQENIVLMRALTERNTEVQNLRLLVAKINQHNWQLAKSHSEMLAELNLGKDRLKAAQHELGCTSTALKEKSRDLEAQKKLNKQNVRMQNITNMEWRIKMESSQLASHKKTCPPNRKRPLRSQSLVPMPITNQITIEEENQRKPLTRKSIVFKDEPIDLFELEDENFPICSGDKGEIKDGGYFLQPILSALTIPAKSAKVEDEEVQVTSSLKRTSLGRPLRRASEKVKCYKELPLNIKLRRSE